MMSLRSGTVAPDVWGCGMSDQILDYVAVTCAVVLTICMCWFVYSVVKMCHKLIDRMADDA